MVSTLLTLMRKRRIRRREYFINREGGNQKKRQTEGRASSQHTGPNEYFPPLRRVWRQELRAGVPGSDVPEGSDFEA